MIKHDSRRTKDFNGSRKLSHAGTTAMLICLVLVTGNQLLQSSKIRIEKKVETSGENFTCRLPSVTNLLGWRQKIGLRNEQVFILEKLRTSEEKQLVPLNKNLANITGRMDSSTQPDNRAIGLAEIQSIAAEISIPSKQKRNIERSFSELAWKTLSAEQQSSARKLMMRTKRSEH